MTTYGQSRVAPGVPTGGQFAAGARDEASVFLAADALINAADVLGQVPVGFGATHVVATSPARLHPDTLVQISPPFGQATTMRVHDYADKIRNGGGNGGGGGMFAVRLEDPETGLLSTWDFGEHETLDVLHDGAQNPVRHETTCYPEPMPGQRVAPLRPSA